MTSLSTSTRFSLAGLFLVSACATTSPPAPPSGTEDTPSDPCRCELWRLGQEVGKIPDPLVELSGLVASRKNPGVLYAHNDSGDSARFFALSSADAGLLETFVLPGATAGDWEDIALGPCDAGSCLYLADIGDNQRKRVDTALFKVPEPELRGGTHEVTFERIAYRYPSDEKHNAEALIAHPKTGRLYLFTKEEVGTSTVFRFPESITGSEPVTLERVTQLKLPLQTDRPLTGASINPCGTALLLRLYNRLVELRLPEGAQPEEIFAADPINVPAADEPQGEAVAFSADGRSYFTASEKIVGAPPLYEYRCR